MRNLLQLVVGDYLPWRMWALVAVFTLIGTPLAFVMPLLEKRLIDDVVLPRQLDLLLPLVASYAGLWLVSSAAGLVAGVLRTYLVEKLARGLRHRLFVHCELLSVSFSHREHSARTVSIFFNDVPLAVGLVGSTLVAALNSGVALAIGAVVLVSLSWQLAVVGAVLPPLVGGVALVFTRPLRPATRRAQEKVAELAQHLQESLAGLREVVAFGCEQAQSLRFGIVLGELLRLRMRVALMEGAMGAGSSVFSLIVSLVVVGYGGYLVIRGDASLGTLVAMQTLFSLLFPPLRQLVGLGGAIQKALGAAERISTFLETRPQVQQRPGALAPLEVTGTITFDAVGFAYQPDRPVLHNVSFTAHAGELVALVGPSGAGKSTLVSLLARFYEPTSGRVLLDGTDVRDLSLAGLRRHIGMVFQDTFLFATTVRANLALGRPEASTEELIAAARAAHAWEFIERLPHGLDSEVGERGVRLSEGQKQRLAIARALVRNPRILILDEPTAALDARSERLLQAALDNLMRGRTTLVIAHRLATIRRADRILVLDGGRIVEQGSHAQLLAQDGLYRELFDAQFGVTTTGVSASAAAPLNVFVTRG